MIDLRARKYPELENKIRIYLFVSILILLCTAFFSSYKYDEIKQRKQKIQLTKTLISSSKLQNIKLYSRINNLNELLSSSVVIGGIVDNNSILTLTSSLQRISPVNINVFKINKLEINSFMVNDEFNRYSLTLSFSAKTEKNIMDFILGIEKNLPGIKFINQFSVMNHSDCVKANISFAWFMLKKVDRMDVAKMHLKALRQAHPSIDKNYDAPIWHGAILNSN